MIMDWAHRLPGGETATEHKGVLAGAAIKEEARAKAEEEGLPDYQTDRARGKPDQAPWSGLISSMQPRIRLMISIDQGDRR